MKRKSVHRFSQRSFFSPVFLAKLQIVKEHCLQLLFPRVCPVCGQILKLPKGWATLLSPEFTNRVYSAQCSKRTAENRSFLPHRPSSSGPDTSLPLKPSLAVCRSILICPDCCSSLPLVEGPVCQKCSKPLILQDDCFCESCRNGTRYFKQGKSLWIHDDSARKIVYDLKFHNKRDNADLIAFEMAVQMKSIISEWNAEVMLPVPLHKKRFRERGFNQAQLIAERISFWLSKLFGIVLPVDSDYLLRTENTKPQRILDVSARAQNVKKAFIVSPKNGRSTKCPDLLNSNSIHSGQSFPPNQSGSPKHYRSVILIDDIFTSGATLNACAKTLKEAGTEEVFFLTATVV